jgi:hypothetical protein
VPQAEIGAAFGAGVRQIRMRQGFTLVREQQIDVAGVLFQAPLRHLLALDRRQRELR